MAYYIRPEDSDVFEGLEKPWMLVEQENGDIRFVFDRNAEEFELPRCITEVLFEKIEAHFRRCA